MLSVVTTEYSILSLSFLMNTTFCKVVFFFKWLLVVDFMFTKITFSVAI